MEWRGIETAPPGYVGACTTKDCHYVLFCGFLKMGSFDGPVYVSGWMDRARTPVHNYRYALTITHWAELPAAAGAKS